MKKVTTSKGTRYRLRWRVAGRAVEAWFPTAEAARAKKAEVEADTLTGWTVDPRAGRRSLDDYFAEWLPARLVKGRPLTDSTRVGYRRLWDRTIAPTIGGVALRALRPESVRAWHAELTAARSSTEAAKAYRLLRAVMATAEADQLIRLNPCRIRGAGQEHAAERPMVATSVVLELAEAIEPRYRALVLLAGFGGLRTGENLGLRRRDVDPLHRKVHVVVQAVEVAGHGRVICEPKTEAGRREVNLPRVVAEALAEHLATFTAADPDAPVFTGTEGGPVRRASLSAAWRAALAAVEGAPEGLHLHDLRHHAATLAARAPGITTKELMARIGHASPRAALIYQHATSERDEAVASFLDAQVEAAAGGSNVHRFPTMRGAGAGLGS